MGQKSAKQQTLSFETGWATTKNFTKQTNSNQKEVRKNLGY